MSSDVGDDLLAAAVRAFHGCPPHAPLGEHFRRDSTAVALRRLLAAVTAHDHQTMTRLAVLYLATLAVLTPARELSGQAKPDTVIVRTDSLLLKQLAAASGIDTANVQLKIRGDTAWVWFRRDSRYSMGVELRLVQGRWAPYSSTDTTTAAPPPAVRRPRPETQTVGRFP